MITLVIVALTLWAIGGAVLGGGQDDVSGGSPAPSAVPEDSVPEDAVQPDPVTGAPIPAVGTEARDDMERKEIECFDSGRTDCADTPGAYLDDPGAYP